MDISNIVINDTTTIDDSTTFNLLGEVANTITIDTMNIKASLANTPGTIGTLLDLTGKAKDVLFKNLTLQESSIESFTLIKLKHNAYTSITLQTWELTGAIFTNKVKLVDYDAATISDTLTIKDISIKSNSQIKDSVIFDFKGKINQQMSFNNLIFDTSKFGTGASDNIDNIFINLESTYGATAAITMKDWSFKTSNFEK